MFDYTTKIYASTIAEDLIPVCPMETISDIDYSRMRSEISIENRKNKIESIYNDSKYVEKKISDHIEYTKLSGALPSVDLMYFDCVYNEKVNNYV